MRLEAATGSAVDLLRVEMNLIIPDTLATIALSEGNISCWTP
ncbi:MAG: hypothetical protein RIG62_05230 [Cyclobacteriaceae bacterium]